MFCKKRRVDAVVGVRVKKGDIERVKRSFLGKSECTLVHCPDIISPYHAGMLSWTMFELPLNQGPQSMFIRDWLLRPHCEEV